MQACGIVVPGHRIASGTCGDPRFPDGTIAPQLPFLRAAIPGFDDYLGNQAFAGTINLCFPERSVTIRQPEIRVPTIRWTTHFPPENFLLSRCQLERQGKLRPAFLYIPDPATKPEHFQASSIVEILCGFVDGLSYGDPVTLLYAAEAIAIG